MHKLLIIKAFEKAKLDLEKKGERKQSDNNLSIFISDELTENGSPISSKSLIGYYNSAKEVDKKDDISISQQSVVLNLCKYLNYNSYEEFVKSNTNYAKGRIREFLKRNKVIIILISCILLSSILYITLTQKRWMVWNIDHYEEVKFDAQLLSEGTLKVYKKERIEDFKKVPGDCNTPFFTPSGEVNIWYGKNLEGELECFTSPGLHPETGKTLKAITTHMIDKYLCKDNK